MEKKSNCPLNEDEFMFCNYDYIGKIPVATPEEKASREDVICVDMLNVGDVVILREDLPGIEKALHRSTGIGEHILKMLGGKKFTVRDIPKMSEGGWFFVDELPFIFPDYFVSGKLPSKSKQAEKKTEKPEEVENSEPEEEEELSDIDFSGYTITMKDGHIIIQTVDGTKKGDCYADDIVGLIDGIRCVIKKLEEEDDDIIRVGDPVKVIHPDKEFPNNAELAICILGKDNVEKIARYGYGGDFKYDAEKYDVIATYEENGAMAVAIQELKYPFTIHLFDAHGLEKVK